MADDQVILASRIDIDNVVFSACTEVAEGLPGMSVREKTKWAIHAADRIMEGVDELGGKAKRSEAGKKAAEARYSKPRPTPGPAIPPAPKVDTAANAAAMGQIDLLPPVPPTVVAPAPTIPPPPHPSLAVPGATPAPFGSPPV